MEAQQPENKTDILTWHGTWARRIADVRIRGFNATVHIGNTGVWNLHSAQTQVLYLFKIIHRRHLNVPKKEVQIPPKSSPRDHLKAKNHSDAAGVRKKPILGGRVPRRARQKDPKVDLRTEPRAPKFKIYALYKKKHDLWCQFSGHRSSFWGEKWRRLDTFREMHTVMSSSSIVSGCTIRFACFCHGNCLRFAKKNNPKQHFYSCRIKPPAKTPKGIPRTLQKEPQNPPLLKTPQGDLRNRSPWKMNFCARNSLGDL